MGNLKYTKADRLRKSSDYLYLSKCGNKYFSDYFIIITKNNNDRSRLGLTVSKKVGNAIIRNRIKRIIREYFRLSLKEALKGNNINVIARKGLGELTKADIFKNLRKSFIKIFDKKGHFICNRVE